MRSLFSHSCVQVGDDLDAIPHYIYHCNAQNPSGEGAFHAMQARFGWAKNPMLNRIHLLDPSVPLTMVYGSKSWVSVVPEEVIREKRPDPYVRVETIVGAGHHVYADRDEEFNKIVFEACRLVDESSRKAGGKGSAEKESQADVLEKSDTVGNTDRRMRDRVEQDAKVDPCVVPVVSKENGY
jgi:abhydrolase domain-containing protein 5